MNHVVLREIVKQTNAQIVQSMAGRPILYISTDSRTIMDGQETLFFALVSERNDGHNYIPQAYEKGVRHFIFSDPNFNYAQFPNGTFLLVNNTLEALQQLAAYMRQCFEGQVIGITGSNGKTIVKEWLNELLATDFPIIRSPKSYNSQIGVPLSVWLLKDQAELALIEAGISQPGEMEKLEQIIKPDIGVITNVGEAHQSNFESVQQKAIEKVSLFKDAKMIIYRSDYPEIDEAVQQLKSEKEIRTFTWSMMDETADLFVYMIQKIPGGCGIIAQAGEKQFAVSIPFSDDASVEDACICLAVLICLGRDNDLVLNRFSSLQPVAMRLEIKQGNNQCIIINDSYNSDLNSLYIAAEALELQASEDFLDKTLILSDIYQSSKEEQALYEDVAKLIFQRGIEKFIGIGPQIKEYAGLFDPQSKFFDTTEDFLANLSDFEFRREVILIKGAHDFGMDRIASALQQKAHETVLEIDLSAMIHNFNYFRNKINPDTKVMVMVKAFSYGSGLSEIARMLEFHHADYLAVAIADEGVELRKAGITMPIVVMNPQEQSFDAMLENRLEPNIYSIHLLEYFLTAARRNAARNFPIHIKIDTGMKRLGLEGQNQIDRMLEMVNGSAELEIASVFTHLVASDDPDHDEFTKQQFDTFYELAKYIQSKSEQPIMRHILNSAGIERFRQYQFEMVRLGIGLYGVGVHDHGELQNVGTLKTTISQVRPVKAGETIGYGRKGIATKDTHIATLPIGYADGLNRKLSNGIGKVWVNNHLVPIIGNVCMDMCMIDLGDVAAKEGDRVVIFGKEQPAAEMAKALDTIPYEILTSISQRVKRVYYQE